MLARFNRGSVPGTWDDFFNDSFFDSFNLGRRSASCPAVNIMEDEKEFRIDVAAPGLSKDDIKIDLDDDVLTVSSEQKDEKEDKSSRYMRREFSYSSFKRSFQLPDTIDRDHIRASHDSGILTIQLPKKKEVVQKASKQIEIS
jgi:HSP20 family protein